MRPLPPETEGVEEFVVDALHDLAYSSHPPPESLGPASLARVSFGRMDDGCSVVLLPAAMVLEPFETLVGYVGSRRDRAHADEPGVRLSPHTAKKVSASCWSEVEAAPKQNPVMTPEESTAASKLKP